MQKVGGIWSHIIFSRILFEGDDEKTWQDLEPYNFRWILFEGADEDSWRDLEPYNFQPDSF